MEDYNTEEFETEEASIDEAAKAWDTATEKYLREEEGITWDELRSIVDGNPVALVWVGLHDAVSSGNSYHIKNATMEWYGVMTVALAQQGLTWDHIREYGKRDPFIKTWYDLQVALNENLDKGFNCKTMFKSSIDLVHSIM